MNPCSQRGWGCERFLQGRLMSPFPHTRQQIPGGSLDSSALIFFFPKLGKKGRFCLEALCERWHLQSRIFVTESLSGVQPLGALRPWHLASWRQPLPGLSGRPGT